MVKVSRKILIRGVNWIGDAVMTLPAVAAIGRAFPDAEISLLVKPWVAEIFKECPEIDDIILYDDRFEGIAGKFRLARVLRGKNFEMAILFQNAFDAAFISWLAGIPVRAGYARDGRSFLLTRAVPVNRDNLGEHQVFYYLNLLNSMNIKTDCTHPYIRLSEKEREWAGNLVLSGLDDCKGPLIGINPGATYGSAKRWPARRFAELINKITDRLNGRVIIFGSRKEVDIANEIYDLLKPPAENTLIMSGKTDLRELAALIFECDAFITNDSGPMHIASALFVPTVAIFGSTNYTATGPFGKGHTVVSKDLDCSPCIKRECPEGHTRCMTEISEDDVFNALTNILPVEKAVFLDKDGTIIEDKDYLNSFEDLEILPDASDSLTKLKEAGFKLIGVTNQSGIGRSIVDEEFVLESQKYLENELGIDDFFYCPHHPDDHCFCRKPEPAMLLTARLKHRIDLKQSYVIGDKESDVQLARNTGVTGILLSSGQSSLDTSAAYVADSLREAARWILQKEEEK